MDAWSGSLLETSPDVSELYKDVEGANKNTRY